MALILASTSPYRRELFMRLRLPFESHAPLIDEEKIAERNVGIGPVALARLLATEKASSLIGAFANPTIVGCDQVVDVDGRILGKPQTIERAVEQLFLLQGRQHRLITAVAVYHEGEMVTHVDQTHLSMRPLDRVTIARYVAQDSPLDCAGSYRIESLGISLFDRIESADHTAIVGLPLLSLAESLRRCGYVIP